MDFPRLQFAVLALTLFVVEIVWVSGRPSAWPLLAVTGACFAWQLWWILPYAPIWPVEAESAVSESPREEVVFLTANVLMDNRDADAFLALVGEYEPDVLVTLESDAWWQDRLDALESEMPFTIKHPLANRYGMHVYSRLPLEDAAVEFLIEDDVPSMHALVRLPSGRGIRAHFLHPAPPSPTENPESTERDAELVVVAKSLEDYDGPVVVTGDLNDVAWSATTRLFRRLSGLVDPRVGRGLFNTYHARLPFVRWPLDHLLHSTHFRVVSIHRLPSFGSDHFPLFTRLCLVGEGGGSNEPRADADEAARARALAREEGVSPEDVPRPGEG